MEKLPSPASCRVALKLCLVLLTGLWQQEVTKLTPHLLQSPGTSSDLQPLAFGLTQDESTWCEGGWCCCCSREELTWEALAGSWEGTTRELHWDCSGLASVKAQISKTRPNLSKNWEGGEELHFSLPTQCVTLTPCCYALI